MEGYEQTETGLYYKFHIQGSDTTHPKFGDVVKLKMIKRFEDSILDNTNTVNVLGMDQYLQEPVFKGAIEEGLLLMAPGDSATFLINTDSINKYYPAPDSTKNFKPGSYLAFDIKLVGIRSMDEVIKEEEEKRKMFVEERKAGESQELKQYLEGNHIESKPTSSGLYYVEKEKGKGAFPKSGDSVIVHYTGTFLNGTIFDSSVKRKEPFGFTLGQNRVIPGWEEAISMMKKGTVATIILPSALAYDSTGVVNPQTGQYFIPPYAPMVFEIQLIDIK